MQSPKNCLVNHAPFKEQDALQALVAGDMSGLVRVPVPCCSTRARHEAIRDYDVCHF